MDWGFGAPVAVRTGNFSSGLDTFEACHAAGLHYSSNIAAALSPKALPYHYGLVHLSGVTELPLTSFHSYDLKGRPSQRIMAITACSFSELSSVLTQAWQQGLGAVCILTHPFEFIQRRGDSFEQCRVNRLNQRRFTALCEFIARQPERFRSATFAELPERAAAISVPDALRLQGSYAQMLWRTAQNVLNDRIG